jgi:D-glycero-alpha-D-manno-heptose-7-phosphate kinase
MRIEQDMLREQVGSQDQVSAAFGGLNRIGFSGNHDIQITPIVLPRSRMEELQAHLMLFYTRVVRNSSDIERDKTRSYPLKGKELERMTEMVDEGIAVLNGSQDIANFGMLMAEAWEIKKGLSRKVSLSIVDHALGRAKRAGAIGGKVVGAGGGGFVLVFAPPECHSDIRAALDHLLYVPFRFEDLGSHVIYHRDETA